MSTTAGSANSARYVDFDEYVELKLQKTQSSIKATDLLVALAGVAAMFLGYLLAFVVLDQWVVPGGFGVGMRWTLLLTLLVATVAWLVWKVGRPYLRSVNGLFAAREIEKSEPGLKSNLLNLVDLRAAGRDIEPSVLRALERHAAVQLQQIDVTQAVDHRPLMRTAYVLLAVLVMFCAYALFSPKKISNSIWRSLGADMEVATRTEIIKVHPGDTTVLAREQVEILVDLVGVIPERAEVLFTTVDGKFQNERVILNPDETKTRFRGTLVGENGQGLLQDLTYVVHANDAVSKTYRITVEQPPSATPEKVKFEFPTYMKLETTEQPGGLIEAWEGTKVTLTAHTNMPVKSAIIEFLDEANSEKSNGEEVPMTVSSDGQHLEAKWTLTLRSDATHSKHYRIQCTSKTGATDPKPTVYGITIRPDLAPEVALLEPVRDLEAPANAVIPLLVQARDPDFELSRINLHVEKAGRSLLNESLSDTKQSRAVVKHDLALQPLGLDEGDVIEFWVEAFDNKQPRANRKNTPRLKVTIIKPVSPKEAQQQLAEDKERRDQKLAEAQQEQNADGQPDQQQRDGGANEPPRDPNDGKQPDRDPMPRDDGEPSKDDAAGTEGSSGKQAPSKGKEGKQSPSANGSNQRDPDTSDGKGKDASNDNPKPGDPKPDGSRKDGKSGTQPQPLRPDGRDDDKALEKLIEKLGKPQDDKQGDEKTRPDGSNADAKDTPPPKGQGGEKVTKPETTPPNGADTKPKPAGTKDDSTTKSDPATKNEPGTKSDSDAKDNPRPGQKPDGTDPGNTNPKKADDPASKSDTKPNPDSKPNTDSKPNPDSKGPRPESTTKDESKTNDSDPTKKEKGPKGTEAQPDETNKPSKRPGDKGDKPENGPSPEKTPAENTTGPGEKPDPNSSKQDGSDKKPSGTPDPTSPNKQTPDSPDAVKKPGAKNEKGIVEPEHDPDVKPTDKEKGLNRDPNNKGTTRPAEPKEDGTPPVPKNDSKDNSTGGKKPGPQPKDQKIEQQPTEPGKTPMPQSAKTPPKESDPTADEPLKNAEPKDQKSDKPTGGGEQGLSKPDQNGTSGANESGKGDPSKRPGTQQKADSKTGQPGDSKQQGPGSKTQEKDKPGASKDEGPGGDEPDGTGKPELKDKPDADGKPSEKGSQQDEDKGAAPPNGKPSGSGKPDGKKPGADQKPGANPQQGKEQGKPQGGDKAGDNKPDSKGDSGKDGDGKGEAGKGKGKPSDKPGKSAAGGKQGARSDGAGAQPGPGADAPNEDAAAEAAALEESEAANLEYNRQASELVLKRLQAELERGDVDPELLEQLGWTKDEMKRFADRLGKHLEESKSLDETPESIARRQQFEEMLKSLDLKKQGTKRSGENSPQRDVNQIESRRANVPPQYRKAYEQFTKDLARQKQAGSKAPSK